MSSLRHHLVPESEGPNIGAREWETRYSDRCTRAGRRVSTERRTGNCVTGKRLLKASARMKTTAFSNVIKHKILFLQRKQIVSEKKIDELKIGKIHHNKGLWS